MAAMWVDCSVDYSDEYLVELTVVELVVLKVELMAEKKVAYSV